jgi:hypothetical protein
VVSTKPHLPWQLVWHDSFATEQEARDFARHLRSRSGTEFVYKKLISIIFPDFWGKIGNILES